MAGPYFNDSFLSVVNHRDVRDLLVVVRAGWSI